MTKANPRSLKEQISYLVAHSRSVCIKSGFDGGKSTFSTAKPSHSIFRNIHKAKRRGEDKPLSAGIYLVQLESREYDVTTFPAPSIEEAVLKAVKSVRDTLRQQQD